MYEKSIMTHNENNVVLLVTNIKLEETLVKLTTKSSGDIQLSPKTTPIHAQDNESFLVPYIISFTFSKEK